jgi:nitroreductase
MDVFEAMRTTGTCRYFRPDPVPDEVLMSAFEAARFAPQGGPRTATTRTVPAPFSATSVTSRLSARLSR